MTDATITDADAKDVGAEDAGVEDAGVEDAGADQPELAGPLEPEGPIKDRLLLPLVLPWLCILAVGLYALNISRIFLAGDSTSALIIGSLVTVAILAGAAIISAIPRLRTSSLAMIMGFVLVIVVSGGLLTLGPSLESGEEGAATGYVKPTTPPVATLDVIAGPGTKFDAKEYTVDTAGVIAINYTGEAGHTLVFTDPKLAGFKLATSGKEKGDVDLKPGQYVFYCDIPGHRAAGMEATLTVP
ncbi:MAG: plastocyanin/azurin family copper-binding protein [Acidimicrobiia bacterium]